MPSLFVDLAIPVAVNKVFTYSVPEHLHPLVKPGIRVVAPFAGRTAVGIVVRLSPESGIPRTKDIAGIVDPEPLLSGELLNLASWISDYYLCPMGEVVKSMLVRGAMSAGKNGMRLSPKIVRVVVVSDDWKSRWKNWLEENSPRRPGAKSERRAAAIRNLLGLENGHAEVAGIQREKGISRSVLNTLAEKGLVEITGREVRRIYGFEEHEGSLGSLNIVLNPDQQAAIDAIRAGVAEGAFRTFLIHGVTGSGKTQVYIEAIRDVLERGRSAIVLVPEIALTPQIVRRFQHRFGNQVIQLHSRMSAGERFDAWRSIREGNHTVVIGPRSAVFAPLKDLGLIVVDEEHESTYKQFDQSPRYHARDVAIVRASCTNAVVVLGSATPSFESYTNALEGKFKLLNLPQRVDRARLPEIRTVNLAEERARQYAGYRAARKAAFKADAAKARADKKGFTYGMISDELREELGRRLAKNEGVIFLQNRRGFSPVVACEACGYVELCANCSISMTYHLSTRRLLCHYCGFSKEPVPACPRCGHEGMRYRGFGTQRIEEEIHGLFPGARVTRMDLDTTSQKGAHDRILRKFADGGFDILLGTQMVAKGLDFPRVTLVGVISADTQMQMPDFRSAERTFQLLTQVAGRAGRKDLEGEVIIQTFQPHHYGLKHVLDHDFVSFYNEEAAYRRELLYPPYSRLARIECRGSNEGEVRERTQELCALLKEQRRGLIVLGPAPAALTRLKGDYRWNIVVKAPKSVDPSGRRLHELIRTSVDKYEGSKLRKKKSVRVIVDIDPVGMM